MDYEDIEDLCEQIVDMYHEESYVTVVGHYDEIIAIMNELARYDELFLYDLDIQCSELSDYDDEYILTIIEDGSIFVQKAIDENGDYYELEGMVVAFDGVSDELLSQMDFSNEEDNDDCERDEDGYHTEFSFNKDGQVCGFTRSKAEGGSYYSESFYSTDEDLLNNIYGIFKF